MPNGIHRTTGKIRLSRPQAEFQPDADWLTNSPSWNAVRDGLGYDAHTPAEILAAKMKINGTDDDVMEKSAQDIEDDHFPVAQADKHAELAARLNSTQSKRLNNRSEPTIEAEIDAATTVAEVDAVVIDDSDAQAFGAMVGDTVFLVLDIEGVAMVPSTWQKITGVTAQLGNSVGVSLNDGGASNRIKAEVDCRVEVHFGTSFLVGAVAGLVEVAISKNGGAPDSNFVRGGYSMSGDPTVRFSSMATGPLDLVAGDYLEVWCRPAGAGTDMTCQKMHFTARRIA